MKTQGKSNPIKYLFFSLLAVTLIFGMLVGSASAQISPEVGLSFVADPEIKTPQLEILSASSEAIDLNARFSEIVPGHTTIAGQEYLTLTGEGYFYENTPGAPALPVMRKMVEVPLEAKVSVELLGAETQSVSLSKLGLDGVIAPVQEAQPKCSGPVPPTAPDAQIYGSGLYPNEPVAIINDFIMRGHRVVVVETRPIRYNAVSGELETISEMNFRLNLEGSNMQLTNSEADRLNSQAFNSIMEPEVLNYNQGRLVTVPKDGERILIITADMFQSALGRFVTLKQSQGFQVSVVNMTTIGSNTTAAIRSYILQQYNGATPPVYVILVGDYVGGDPVGSITNWDFRTGNDHRTDLHYYTMDNDTEYTPDVFGARFPVRTVDHLNAMIDKYFAYENASGAEPWVKKAEYLASDDSYNYHIAEGSHNFVINSFTLPRGYTGIFPENPQPGGDKIYAITHNATGADAVASMNDDRVFLVYSGHGATTYWDGPRVTQSDIRNMTGVAIPYVASHACVTADFYEQEAFSDTWVIEPVNGSLTFFGASHNSYWPEDDTLERSSFSTLFRDEGGIDVPSVGAFTQSGLLAVAASGSIRTNYYWEEYHVFGDPTLVVVMGPKYPDFRMSVEPEALKTCSTSTNQAVVNLTSINDFANAVDLSASTVAGFTTTFAPQRLTPPGSSNLTIAGDGTAEAGTQVMTITGVSGELEQTAELTLNIYPPIAGKPMLSAPQDNARDQSQRPAFSWTAAANAETYQLQIAKDPNFTEIVLDKTGIEGTSFTPNAPLVTDTQYYWRVKAENICGVVDGEQVFTFRTKAGPGDCAQGTVKDIIRHDDFEDGLNGWENPSDANYPEIKFNLTTVAAYSPTQSVLGAVPALVTDQRLVSPVMTVPDVPDPVSLIFWHKWTFDSNTACNDGGILEFSYDQGNTWNQVAMSYLLTSKYNGTVKNGVVNPLVGKPAWCFASDEWVKTVVDLTFAKGKDVQFRFRLGTGIDGEAEGWYIDDVTLQACVPGVSEYKLHLPLIVTNK